MKKIILLAALVLTAITNAQTITATGNGQPISEGQTFTFNTLPQDTAELDLLVTNVSNAPINVKLKINTITGNNNNGGNVQFCFGEQCYFQIDPGDMVPSNPTGVTLQPGQHNNINDHFWNNNPGNGTDPVSYNLSFVRLNDEGAVVETLLTFNYVYQPTMGVDNVSLSAIGIKVYNTIVKSTLDINADQQATLEVYNINGQLVKTAAIATGVQSVDLSALNASVYIAKFTNSSNQSSQIKFIKK